MDCRNRKFTIQLSLLPNPVISHDLDIQVHQLNNKMESELIRY